MDDGNDGSLLEDIKVLIDDGRTVLEAELAFQKVRVAYGWRQGRTISVLVLAGLTAGFFAAVALVVGLLLALIPLVGPWGALGMMAGVLLVIAVVCIAAAARKFKHARQQMFKSPPLPDTDRLASAVARDNRHPEKGASS